jgi:PAS domain S-box-containing protein
MRRRLSARVLLTLMTTSITAVVILITISVVRSALAGGYARAIPETTESAWTIGVLLIGLSAAATWLFSGWLLRPLEELRRAQGAAARTRNELDTRAHTAEIEQRRLLSLFEAISEGIVQIGPGARIVHTNTAARSLLGLPEDAQGQTAAALVRNLELRELIDRAARGEAVEPTEVTTDTRHLLVAPQQLPTSGGKSAGAVITVVDLTELRRVESVRRDFVANVSHELKTPLTAIRGYTETLLTDDLPPEMRQQFLEVVHKNTTRIHRIVEDLLDLSRLQSGGWQPDLQDVDAAALARDVWSTLEQSAKKKGITFSISGDPLPVLADPGGLRQVLANLLDNALRYTPDGGRIGVTLGPVTIGENGKQVPAVELLVRDNGVGIPTDALTRIFERFYRVDPARSRAEGGTGLGLSIVKHLIERMDGDVVAESELGKGTTIRIRLPAASVHA